MEPLLIGLLVGGSAAISWATGWFLKGQSVPPHEHQPAPTPPAPRVNLDNAVETVLVKSMEAQGNMFERMQRLNIENAELAMEAIQRNGFRRAGRKRANTAARTKTGTFRKNCRICDDPMVSDPTPAEIIAHSQHRTRSKRPENFPVAVEDKGDHLEAHVDERAIQVGPDGIEQIECPDCGHNHAGAEHHH